MNIFTLKIKENGEWTKFQNEEFHSLYCLPNGDSVIKFRRLRWTGYIARMKEVWSAFIILTGEPTGKNL